MLTIAGTENARIKREMLAVPMLFSFEDRSSGATAPKIENLLKEKIQALFHAA